MKNLFVALLILISSGSFAQKAWTSLLDKDLDHWDTYLSYRFEDGYKGAQPKDAAGNLIEPIGLNKDEFGVFTVIKEGNEPVLKISGEIYGCVVTKKDYRNYHFRLKVKWGDKKLPPREKLLKDSGIMYHSVGDFGKDYWRSWMLSQEFQVMEGHLGDFWSQQSSSIEIKAYLPEGSMMNPVADESQPFIPLGKGSEYGGFCLRSCNYEKTGEWNTLELICYEGKSLHIVNGHVVMILQNSKYEKDGKTLPLDKGKIQLQSEAAEVFYKDIEIRELKSLPNEYAKYFK